MYRLIDMLYAKGRRRFQDIAGKWGNENERHGSNNAKNQIVKKIKLQCH
jgi:hypothetical protein